MRPALSHGGMSTICAAPLRGIQIVWGQMPPWNNPDACICASPSATGAAMAAAWETLSRVPPAKMLASGAPHSQILSMLRWRSDEALRLYARLNDTTKLCPPLKLVTSRVQSAWRRSIREATPGARPPVW